MIGVDKRLHGRRKGRPLSPTRRDLVARRLPELRLDPSTPTPASATELFTTQVDEVVLEVGCGGGEHLIHDATTRPLVGHIGVEPFEQGLGKMVAAIDAAALPNVRVYDGDAALILDWLPAGSLSRVDVFYPDPWPKRRHRKRRFISDDNLDRIARALRPGGLLRCVSDISAYIDWVLQRTQHRRDFHWTAIRADDWRKPYPGWPGTRYEAKARREGRVSAYLSFKRV